VCGEEERETAQLERLRRKSEGRVDGQTEPAFALRDGRHARGPIRAIGNALAKRLSASEGADLM
jgi:hypothetical protein